MGKPEKKKPKVTYHVFVPVTSAFILSRSDRPSGLKRRRHPRGRDGFVFHLGVSETLWLIEHQSAESETSATGC